MLDVHPPHAPTHTWKDFFIHVGTICVGLLIAVGLEQTVESLHHAHQRRELLEALLADTKINDTWAKNDIQNVDGRRHWFTEQLTAIERAGPSGSLKLRRLPRMTVFIPNTGVWLAARQNGQAAYLSTGEQNVFFDTDRVEEGVFVAPTGSCARYFNALTELDRQLLGRAVALPTGELDLSGLTPEQRLKLAEQLRSLIIALRDFEVDLVTYSTATEFILTTPPGQLDETVTLDSYRTIRNRNYAAHPDLNSILQSE